MKKFAAIALALASAAAGLRGERIRIIPSQPPPGDATVPAKATPDPAGDHLLVLKDGSHIHGRLVTFGKSEIVWQRADTAEPLVFLPADVLRIHLGGPETPPARKAGATLKLAGDGWITGGLTSLKDGKFQLALDGAGTLAIQRGQVEWLHLSKNTSTDAYEGPSGPMGLAGWTMFPRGAWDYADGSIVGKVNTQGQLMRRFEQLGDKLDIEFSTTDGGAQFRNLNFSITSRSGPDYNARSSCLLTINSNQINVTSQAGGNQKRLFTNIPADKNDAKQTRYRILHDRGTGKMFLFVNGNKVADWGLQPDPKPQGAAVLRWQPYQSDPNTPWTLSKVRVRPWDGSLETDAKPEEAGKDLLFVLKPPAKPALTGWPIVNGVPAKDGEKEKPVQPRNVGSLDSLNEETVRFSGADFSRADDLYIRLAAPAAEPSGDTVARIGLARGEFCVTAFGFRDGAATVRTAFAGEASIPLAALRSIEFSQRQNAADKAQAGGGDALVFANGDELNGKFAGISKDQKLAWKLTGSGKVAEFPAACLAGVTLGGPPTAPVKNGGTDVPAAPAAAVRFRNRDWLPGKLLQLDKTHLRMQAPVADELRVSRGDVQSVYFARNGGLPFCDGSHNPQSWMSPGEGVPQPVFGGGIRINGGGVLRLQGKGGMVILGGGNGAAPAQGKFETPWRYFGGAYTLPLENFANGMGASIGRTMESLPEKVEFSFDIAAGDEACQYLINLLHEGGQGITVNGSWNNAYINDTTPRKRPVSNYESLNVDFGEAVRKDTARRSFRFLADRRSGEVAMIVNGNLVAEMTLKGRRDFARPGNFISITPQSNRAGITFSNLWIGPWNGVVPKVPRSGSVTGAAQPEQREKEREKEKTAPAAEQPAAPAGDTLLLANGDEISGTIEDANGDGMRVQSELGALDIPAGRIVAAEFDGPPAQVSKGVRLFLRAGGVLTVDSLQVSEGKVSCRSAVAGDLAFDADALSEIIFLPAGAALPENYSRGRTGGTELVPGDYENNEFGWRDFQGEGWNIHRGGINIQGGGQIILD